MRSGDISDVCIGLFIILGIVGITNMAVGVLIGWLFF